jgi:DNA-binding transcriptional ArsR family regulator
MREQGVAPDSTRRGGRRKGSGKRADASAPWAQRAVQALADGSRWSIIHYLSTHEATVGAIAATLGLSVACASKHLSILKAAELVVSTKHGREVLCRIADPGSRAGELLRAVGTEVPAASRIRPAATPELETTPAYKTIRYQSKDMDDFLL